MSRVLPTTAALLVAVVLQAALASRITIFDVPPNLIFLVVVTLALVEGPVAGCAAGFAGGLAFDLLGSSVVGPHALVFCIVGYVAGLLEANMFAEGWLLPVSVVFVASLVSEVAYGLVMAVLDAGAPFGKAFLVIMLPGAVYNTALAVLFYPVLTRILRRDRTVKSFQRLA